MIVVPLVEKDFFGTKLAVSPSYSFGNVTFSNSGVSVWCVVDRFLAGESPEDIAADYSHLNLTECEVLSGIRFIMTRRRKRNRDFIALGRRQP